MNIIAVIPALLVIVMTASCSTRNVYEGLRIQQDGECQKLQGIDRDECAGRSGMSYDEYQRQLKERQTDR